MKTITKRRYRKTQFKHQHHVPRVLRRSQWIGAAIIASSGMIAFAATVPNTFTSGSPAVAADVNANFQALATALTTAETKIAALETKLASVSIENVNGHTTVRFTGVNVQVVNGQNETATANGTGNLIVGYDEAYTGGVAKCTIGTNPNTNAIVTDSATCSTAGGTWTTTGFKSGSHYLVIGSQNNYSRWGGLIAGSHNFSNYNYASVSGGYGNTASGHLASVSGGSNNTASSSSASVSGGYYNIASGAAASVSGGSWNSASGSYSGVSGGGSNIASGQNASVSGGKGCTVSVAYGWDVGTTDVFGVVCSPNVGQ